MNVMENKPHVEVNETSIGQRITIDLENGQRVTIMIKFDE